MPKLTTGQKLAQTRKHRAEGKKASFTRKRRSALKKAASTKKSRAALVDVLINKPNTIDEFYTEEGCWILEVWRDNAVTIARARVAPGVTTKAHLLRGVAERYLIIEGKGVVRVGEKSPEEVGPGDVVAIPPQVSQSITNLGLGDLVFYCVCTPPFTQNCYKSLE